MKKKLFAAALAIYLLVSMAVPAFAADQEITGSSGTTYVTYTQASGYKIVFPSEITLSASGEVSLKVEAKEVSLDSDKTLRVTVFSTNTWKIKKKNANNEYDYELKNGSTVLKNNDEVLSVPAGTDTKYVNLTASIPKTVAVTGTYTDTLTFNISIGS